METMKKLFVFFVFVTMAASVTYADDWSSFLYQLTNPGAPLDNPDVTLSVIHAPVAPVIGGTITFTGTDSPAGYVDPLFTLIYLDNVGLQTSQVCDEIGCRYIATKPGITAGYHTYYLKALYNGNYIYSPTMSFTVSNSPPTITISHSPEDPVQGDSVTVKATPNLLGGAIFMDGVVLPTTEYCDADGCGFTATKTNIAAGQHQYYATAPFGQQTITSVTKTFYASPATLPVINSFTVYPIVSIPPGATATLSWQTTGATSASIDKGIGSVPTSGSVDVHPTTTTTYTLTATSAAGSVTKSVTVGVITGLPVIESFTATPDVLSPGQSSTLSWVIKNATLATISGVGSVNPKEGRVSVTPVATTTYILTADNGVGPVTKSVTVFVGDVNPEPGTITVTHSPQNPVADEVITFTVRNVLPSLSASSLTGVTVYVDGIPLRTQYVCLAAATDEVPTLSATADSTGGNYGDTSGFAAPTCKTLGEMCGGIAGFQCCDGLTCKLDGTYPDAAGTCIRNPTPIPPTQICKTLGQTCGGFGNFQCCSGLTCLLTSNLPDASGTCASSTDRGCRYVATTSLKAGTHVYYATAYIDGKLVYSTRTTLVVSPKSRFTVSHSPLSPTSTDKIIFTARSNELLTDVQLTLTSATFEKAMPTILKMTTTCKPVLSAALDPSRCTYTASTSLTAGDYVYYAAGYTDSGSMEKPTVLVQTDRQKLTVRDASGPKILVTYSPKEPTPNSKIIFNAKLGPVLSANALTELTNVLLYIGNSAYSMQKVCIGSESTQTFKDVPPGNLYYNSVETVYAKGIMAGTGSGMFGVDNAITRGEAAVAIATRFNLPTISAAADTAFSDVPTTHPYYKFIRAVYSAGISAGCGANKFCPDAKITRADFMVWMTAAMKLDPNTASTTPVFKDVPSTHPRFKFIQLMYEKGITVGCGESMFCPEASTTRGQAAAFIAASLQYEPGRCSMLGAFCGGIASFQCCGDFTCRLDGTYPDAGGTCVKETTSRACSWTASTTLAAGTYRYRVTGNYGNQQISSDTGVITVAVPETKPKFRMYFSPEEPLSNEDILFTVQPSTDAMTNVQIYVDGVMVKTEAVCIQTFAQTDHPTCHYRATKSLLAGRHSFYATANYADMVIKSDVRSFAVVDPQTSKFLHVYHSPENPMGGETITFSAASRLNLDKVVMYVGGVAYETKKVCLSSADRETALSKVAVDPEDNDTDVVDRLRPTCRYIATTALRPGRYAYYAVGSYGQRILRSDSQWVAVRSQDVPKFDVSHTPETPTIAEQITFDAYSPDNALTDVVVYLDGKMLETDMNCLRSIPGGCHYIVTSEAVKAGLHTYYARGAYNKRIITTEIKKFYVVAREQGHVRIGHAPYYPTTYDTITFFARTNVKLTEMNMVLDGNTMKMTLVCIATSAADIQPAKYRCAYTTKVSGLKPGDHKYYAIGSGADGVKYGSKVRTFTVSEEVNTLNIPAELDKETAYEVAQIVEFNDVINSVNIAPTTDDVYMNYPRGSNLMSDPWTDPDTNPPRLSDNGDPWTNDLQEGPDWGVLAKPKYDDVTSWPDTEWQKHKPVEGNIASGVQRLFDSQ